MFGGIRRRLNRSRYLRDMLWQMSGNGFAQALGIVAMPLLTRLYAPADFATLNLFMQVVAGLTVVLTWRFEYLVMLPKTDAQAMSILRAVALGGAALTAVATLGARKWGEQSALLFGDPALAPWLLLAPLTAWLICLSIALQHVVQRREDFRNAGFSEVVSKGGYIASALIGAAWLPKISGLMASPVVGACAKVLWLARTLRISQHRHTDQVRMDSRPALRPYVRLAVSMSFSNLLAIITAVAPMVFIARQYGSTSLGQFGLVVSTLYLPSSLLGNAIGQVYYQRASQRHAHGEVLDDLWRSTAWQLVRIGVPLYGVIALLSPFAYPLLFGNQWEVAGEYAMLMAMAAGLSFITSPLDRTSVVVNAWWYLPFWHALRALTTVAVVETARHWEWPPQHFMLALAVQMSGMYVIDWFAGWHFSRTTRILS